MSLSNSFHSSAKKHAITSSGKLASVQRHNERGYYSRHYDASKIQDIIGEASKLVEDVEKYLNDTFSPTIARYNEKQKRADRRITETPYEYFCSNKSLDIANEAIFQIGDKEFWSRWRTDTPITVAGKELVLKSYPEEVKEVMGEIYRRQAEAYEQIYTTHGKQILELIKEDLKAAEDIEKELSEDETKKFASIFRTKGAKERKTAIDNLEDPDKYMRYSEAMSKKTAIDKLKLVSRIENHQMKIKLVNLTAHYDEYSPHAHGVSVCWTSDYKTGLSDRVAKSVVLNPWALTVIQDRLREIAEEEIQKHPDIFQEQSLGEKKRGRNFDYSTEEITRKNQQELVQRNQELEARQACMEQQIAGLTENISLAEDTIQQLKDQQELAQKQAAEQAEQMRIQQEQAERQLQEQLQKGQKALAEKEEKLKAVVSKNEELTQRNDQLTRENEELQQKNRMLRDYDEYVAESDLAHDGLTEGEDLMALVAEAKPLRRSAAETLLKLVMEKLEAIRDIVERCLYRMRYFEVENKVEEKLSEPIQARKASLDAKIFGASKKAQEAATVAQEKKKNENGSFASGGAGGFR